MIEANYDEIKVGESFLYDEEWYLTAYVNILESTSNEMQYNFKLEIIQIINALGNSLKIGDVFRLIIPKKEYKDRTRRKKRLNLIS